MFWIQQEMSSLSSELSFDSVNFFNSQCLGWEPATQLLQEGDPSRPENGLLSNVQKWIVWGDICADKAKDLLASGPWVESSRIREPKRTALLRVSCFRGNGVSFWVVSSQPSCSASTLSGPGSCLVVPAPLSQDGFHCQGSWEVGCLLPPIGSSQILPPSLQGSTKFFIGASCCETTPPKGYYHTWPRWAVSVNGPLTQWLCFSLSFHRKENHGLTE